LQPSGAGRPASAAGSKRSVPEAEASGKSVRRRPVTSAPLTETRCGADASVTPSRPLAVACTSYSPSATLSNQKERCCVALGLK
jgi:hypothetical protein